MNGGAIKGITVSSAGGGVYMADNSQIWEFLAIISGAGLALLVLKNKKREDTAE